jgi:hypothetical protein
MSAAAAAAPLSLHWAMTAGLMLPVFPAAAPLLVVVLGAAPSVVLLPSPPLHAVTATAIATTATVTASRPLRMCLLLS